MFDTVKYGRTGTERSPKGRAIMPRCNLTPIVGELRLIHGELVELREVLSRRHVPGPRRWYGAVVRLAAVVGVVVLITALGCGAW